jgi:hypothetical protein
MKSFFHQKPLLPAFVLLTSLQGKSAEIDYARDIQPILSEHCFHCHGPDENKREAEMRLDTREGAIAKSDKHAVAIVPGDPEASELIRRVTAKDADDIMPPPDQHKPVNEKQIDLLRQWIKEGAPYTEHWAFVPPVKNTLPNAESNPVDSWVGERLKKEGIALSPAAAPEVLARRIHLDLVGLPPSPAELDSFVAASKADPQAAVVELVDRLLASERFGEKWARHWLDIARYSDSNGFEKDLPREQWAYRDWVIGAINHDMPYNQFLIEQIAGDMLPNRTQDQMIASGFLSNGMINEEGAIIPEQFRIAGVVDRMDVIGKAAIGLSLQCAQCHTHKFDPITHDEYFGIYAFLNDTYEAQSWVYNPEQKSLLERLENEIHTLENRLKSERPTWSQEMETWMATQQAAAIPWTVLDTDKQILDGGVNHPFEEPDHSVSILGHRTNFGLLVFEAEPKETGLTGLRLEALRDRDLPFGGPGRSNRGIFAISEIGVDIKAPGSDEWKPVQVINPSADFSPPEHLLTDIFTPSKDRDKEKTRKLGPVSFLVDGDELLGWYPDRGPVLRHTDSAAAFQFATPLDVPEGTRMRIRVIQVHGGGLDGIENAQLGRVRFSFTRAERPFVPPYDHAATLAMAVPSAERTPEEEAALFRAWRLQASGEKAVNEKIAALEKQFPEAETSVLHQEARSPVDHRVTRLLDRGSWDMPKQEILPHVPAALHPMKSETASRLDFARWLAARESPLTARVQVNRVWQAVFGLGFVESPEDFGVRAPRPEYLELLDWLSVDFMDQNWSLKTLLRTMLTSAVYQQDSKITPGLLEKDPSNHLLARGPRFRLEAEVLRDLALGVGGLMNQKAGGPSVYPPVPQSVLDNNFVKPEYWIAAEDSERYRRSIYLFRKRSMPDPVLSGFDAPYGDFSCARRLRSNSPLSALTSLNEPVFVEAARALAFRVLAETGSSEAERIDLAYRLCTGRNPTADESESVQRFLKIQRDRIESGGLKADEIIASKPPQGIDQNEAAAWVITARVLLNLDETLNKN